MTIFSTTVYRLGRANPREKVKADKTPFNYVDEIQDTIESSVIMFADYTKLWRNYGDELILQHDLDRLEDWLREWLLKLNASKCKVMQIGEKKEWIL